MYKFTMFGNASCRMISIFIGDEKMEKRKYTYVYVSIRAISTYVYEYIKVLGKRYLSENSTDEIKPAACTRQQL